jgi:putative membrane protein
MKAFGLTPEEAADSAVLAANQGLYNQGLYNGFLAAGVVWGTARPALASRSRCFS